MSTSIPATRSPVALTLARYVVRELTGILTLVAVAAFDIASNPIHSPARTSLLILHLLFFASFVSADLLQRLPLVNAHVNLMIFVIIQLLLFRVGSTPTTQIALLFVMSAFAQEALDELPAYLWIIGFGILSMVGFSLLMENPVLGSFVGLGTLGGYFFIGSVARSRRVAEDARAESQRLLQELQIAHAQLQYHAHEAEILAATEERNRVARELHDTLGHRLTIAAVQLEGAQRLIARDPNKAQQMVGIVRAQVLDGLTELRATVAALRTPIGADLALSASLHLLANQYASATGLQVHVDISERAQKALDALSKEARHTLFRCAQEGLTNVQKHAAATTAWIKIDLLPASTSILNMPNPAEAPMIKLTVHDNGSGLSNKSTTNGFGLHGLAERAALANGSLDLQPSPYGGMALSIAVAATIDAEHPASSSQSSEQALVHPMEHPQ